MLVLLSRADVAWQEEEETMTQAHVTITTGQSFRSFRNGAKGTVAELRDAALRAGLVIGDRWNDGSVPVYRDEDERDADTDGGACRMLICVDASEHT